MSISGTDRGGSQQSYIRNSDSDIAADQARKSIGKAEKDQDTGWQRITGKQKEQSRGQTGVQTYGEACARTDES
jgi:hypothetical protein